MHRGILAALVLVSISPVARGNTELTIAARSGGSEPIVLEGRSSSQQLVVTARRGGRETDATHEVTYRAEPEGIVACRPTGLVKPLKNGAGTITVALEGAETTIPFEVRGMEKPSPADFANEVIPSFTRSGCNSGACHGKAGGRDGFRLSLLGYEPDQDYRYIVFENRGRRTSPAAPEQSLLLQKPTGEIPHEGGVRWEVGSEPYELVREWIAQGMPFDPDSERVVERIELFPTGRTYDPLSSQQLVVTAVFNDGTTKDVTHMAQYESNEEEMAHVDESGHVHFKNLWGSPSVLVRFKEHVGTFFGNITLGETVVTPPLRNFIDEHVFGKLELLGLPPSQPCNDATFLRRVSLDIAGRLPTIVEEARAFLADENPAKRVKLVDRLLEDPGYSHHFANKWTVLLRNKRSRYDGARVTFAFYDWIHNAMKQNMPYDEFVKAIVTASGESSVNPSVLWYRSFKNDREFIVEPKERSEDFAQIFLGVRIACAQCHHHPFDKWSMEDYSGLTAFFSGLNIKEGVTKDELVLVRDKEPGSFNDISPIPLGGDEIDISRYQDPRFVLAKWTRDNENPYFAKSLVNRYWKQFFGRGLVDPVDDMRLTNPPTHPELLDALADRFVKGNYDLKALIRLICNSQAYQLSSEPNPHNLGDKQNYSRFTPRRMTAEVYLDSINDVTEMRENFDSQEATVTRVLHLPDDNYNTRIPFLQTFGRPKMDSAADAARRTEATVSQSLAMLNSSEIMKRITYSGGRAARISKLDEPLDKEVTDIFLQAYSRYPREDEIQLAMTHLEEKLREAGDNASAKVTAKKEAIEDVLWALINTKEFMFNN